MSSRRVTAIVLAVTCATLAAGLTLKFCPFIRSPNVAFLCYSDVTMFFRDRGIGQMPFPYIHGGLRDNQMLPGFIEYPVLTGIFAWATARPAWSPRSYLVLSAVFLGPLGLLVSYLLARLSRWRALLFGAAPALVLYAFHNWDLLAVAAAVAGLWCWTRRQPLWAAAFFAIGACAKLYPAIFLAPLVFEALFKKDWSSAVARFSVGVGTAVLVNLPFLVANPQGWFATYQFHATRPPNIDTIWALKFSWKFGVTMWPVETLNLLTMGLLVTSFLAVFATGWLRANRDGSYPFPQVCGAALAVFLLWNKVHSPQYTLWLLPFFALLRVNILWWAAYTCLDALLYMIVFYLGHISLDVASPYLQISVFGRAALLGVLTVVFMRARDAIEADRAESSTHLLTVIA